MGIVLYVLGGAQITLGTLILLSSAIAGSNIVELGGIVGGATGLLLIGMLTGAVTMTVTGLVTVAVGSIHRGVKRLERQFASAFRDSDF